MIIRRGYKFRLEPNGAQQRAMRQFAGCCRRVYNMALARQQELRESGEKHARAFTMNNWLPAWKDEFPYLSEAPSQALQQSLKDLDKGYEKFFAKKAAHPKFHKKGVNDSFRLPQGFELDEGNKRMRLPKLGWIRYRKSRNVAGTIKNITVGYHGGRWYASIQTELQIEQPLPQGDAIGIDLGVARFATLSNGSFIEPLNSFRRLERQLKRAQQAMSRKVKFSSNWKKAKSIVQKIHSRISRARNDFLHKVSTTLSKNHAMAVLEDLQVANMSKSAAGTKDQPGRSVRAKSGLNKSILDQGWGLFKEMLEYKLEERGGYLVLVPPQYTSQTCPECGHISSDNRKTQAKFACVRCGHENHADLVGAINILRAGHARLACGEVVQQGSNEAGTH